MLIILMYPGMKLVTAAVADEAALLDDVTGLAQMMLRASSQGLAPQPAPACPSLSACISS